MKMMNNIKNICFACALAVTVYGANAQVTDIEDAPVAEEQEAAQAGRLFTTSPVTATGAVSSVGSAQMERTVSGTLPNSMAGAIPGLTMIQGDGAPGANTAFWLIRGLSSYSLYTPKIFVDGFEVDEGYMVYMIPSEIESVSILKDGAALASFGMTGANGVIWITTKRGSLGAPKITANVRTTIQQPINVNKPLNAYDYATLYNEAISNDNGSWTPRYSDSQLAGYRNGTEPDIDWADQVLMRAANFTDANVSISGGVPATRYNVLMGYSNQQGLLNVDRTDVTSNINFSRVNLRANLDLEFLKIFEAKIDIGGRLEDRRQPNYPIYNLMENIARYPSNAYWVYDDSEMTRFSGTTVYPDNPVGSIKGLGINTSRKRVMQANFTVREKLDFITPGLYMEEAFSFYSTAINLYNKTGNYSRWLNGANTTTDQDIPIKAGSYGSGGMVDWKQGNIVAGYKQSHGQHNIDAAAAFHISARQGDGLYSYKFHSANLYGRINYNYDSRYTAELGFSYFGSDAFAPGNRWGLYPALSAAWVISNENFLSSSETFRFLKLRASAGRSASHEIGGDVSVPGYDSFGRYLYKQYYFWNKAFFTGNSVPYEEKSSIIPRFIANPDTFADSSMKYNVGLDMNLWGKLDMTLDFFLDKRSDILTSDNSVMNYYGDVYYASNIGKVTNRGFDLGLSYSDRKGSFGYSVFANASYSVNTIDYMAEVTPRYDYNAFTGHAVGTRMGLVADGLYQLDDFNNDGTLKAGLPVPTFGKVQPGDIKYRDLDDSGFIDETDVRKIGDPFYPRFNYSFGISLDWKGFDLNVLLRGAAGASVNLLDYWNYTVAFVDNNNAFPMAKGAWAYYPDQGIDKRSEATYPRLTTTANQNNYRASSYWIRKNNFLRVQNIEIGYDFATNLLRNTRVSSMRLYLNATNPFTFSPLLKEFNMDPESGYYYPALKSWSIGFSITL